MAVNDYDDIHKTGEPVRTTSERTAEFARRLAPLEEINPSARFDATSIDLYPHTEKHTVNINTGELKLPSSIVDEGSQSLRRVLRPHPLVIFIVAVLLGFIAFIAYLVSQMPAP